MTRLTPRTLLAALLAGVLAVSGATLLAGETSTGTPSSARADASPPVVELPLDRQRAARR